MNNKILHITIFRYFLLGFILLGAIESSAQDNKDIAVQIDFARRLMDSSPDSAFNVYCELEKLVTNNNHQDFVGDIAYGKGRYYLLKTEYGKASEELNKAILYFESRGDLEYLSSTYSLMSILYERIGDSEASHFIQIKACNMAKESGNIPSYTYKVTNLVLDYLVPEKLDSAYYYLSELETLKEHITDASLYYYYQNWGTYYYLKGDLEKSILLYKDALDIANEYDMLDSKATIYMLMSKSYVGNNQLDEGLSMVQRSYDISKNNNLIHEQSEALQQMIEIATGTNNFQDAFNYQKELGEIEHEIFNVEKVRKAKEMEGQLNLAQKEKIIAEQELSIKAEQLEADRVKSQNLFLYLVIAIVLLLVSFTLWIYIKTKRLNVSINKQKNIIEEKSEVIEEAYNSIHDSLEYSKYIQRAMLPSVEFFNKNFEDHFILFRPKDIVSGDFYWADEKDGKVYVAAVDCTGHGVPGAMVSIIGYNGLNRCLNELNLTRPSTILNNLSEFVEEALFNEEKEMKDGMDMSLCAFNLETGVLNYSGANNPIYIVSNGQLNEFKPNKQPVGKFPVKKEFNEQEIKLHKGDSVYLFSDGYADQFGGEKGKKMKYKVFKDIILKYSNDTMQKQLNVLVEYFDDWKGDLEQIDDVCIIGIKI